MKTLKLYNSPLNCKVAFMSSNTNTLEIQSYDDKEKMFLVKSPKGNVVKVQDTFAEMFPLWVGRVLITAQNEIVPHLRLAYREKVVRKTVVRANHVGHHRRMQRIVIGFPLQADLLLEPQKRRNRRVAPGPVDERERSQQNAAPDYVSLAVHHRAAERRVEVADLAELPAQDLIHAVVLALYVCQRFVVSGRFSNRKQKRFGWKNIQLQNRLF